MPHGKPAGIPCVQLLPDYRCALFGKPERPAFCASLRPAESMCGTSRAEAMNYLARLETLTLTGESAAKISLGNIRALHVVASLKVR